MSLRRPPTSLALIWLAAGCAGPGPRMFPVAPLRNDATPEGAVERVYDVDRNGVADFRERLGTEGRVVRLDFDLDAQGRARLEVNRDAPAPGDRQLVILIDSVPFELVREMWDQGRFRLFYPPSRTISPFPVMTDLSFCEFFGISPCPAVESEYYDGSRVHDGYDNYVHERNAIWLARTNYHMANIAHAVAYFYPDPWFDHELHYIQKYFLRTAKSPFVGYCVCGSGLGAKLGRDGHLAALIRLDRTCQQIMYETRGRVQMTLLSDHGHNLMPSRRLPLSEYLERCGYRVGGRLERPCDVIVPEFGVITCAAIYTHEPARVAADLALMNAVEQVMYLDTTDEVVVLSPDGRARISRSGDAYRYAPERGDPLKIRSAWDELIRQGRADAQGFIPDRVLFEATCGGQFPDAVHRVWRAFHGLVVNQPQVLLTVEDGWHCGSKLMSSMYDVRSSHGNLGPSSFGFVMTTAGRLPPIMRMEDLRQELHRAGVPLEAAPAE